jgi:hypothetical protein
MSEIMETSNFLGFPETSLHYEAERDITNAKNPITEA